MRVEARGKALRHERAQHRAPFPLPKHFPVPFSQNPIQSLPIPFPLHLSGSCMWAVAMASRIFGRNFGHRGVHQAGHHA